MLIGALRADAQPMVTETNTCLLTGGRHRSRRQRLADARQGPGHAGDHGPGLRGVRSSRRQHFMSGLEIDGLWWCARCLRFAQSESESVIRSASSEDGRDFALLALCLRRARFDFGGDAGAGCLPARYSDAAADPALAGGHIARRAVLGSRAARLGGAPSPASTRNARTRREAWKGEVGHCFRRRHLRPRSPHPAQPSSRRRRQ